MASIQNITVCFTFNNQAEEAVKFYTCIFRNSRIQKVALYDNPKGHQENPLTAVMTIVFELNGQTFLATNTGYDSKFNDAISLQVYCRNQDELDYYWKALSEGGDTSELRSGWLKDKFGISWQIVPTSLIDMITDQDMEKSQRVIDAMLGMKKLNINDLKRAYLGKTLH